MALEATVSALTLARAFEQYTRMHYSLMSDELVSVYMATKNNSPNTNKHIATLTAYAALMNWPEC